MRGIGEAFRVNPANGTLTATVPLPVSPARGFAPELSLTYDAGAGNGPFGCGWALPLPSVARKTDRALPRYVDADIMTFGGDDLVPSLEPDRGPWKAGARDAGTHQVQCFRPRIASDYARIERWRRHSDGDVHWRVRGADNRTSVFGEQPSARIADPADARRVYRWLVERSYDDRGSVIVYRYRAEDGVNVAPAIWEANRAPVNSHIDRVLFGTRAPYDPNRSASQDPADYLFELVFDYGERDGVGDDAAPPYLPPSTWKARADAFSVHKPGFDVRHYRLCQRVLLFHRIDELGEAPVLVKQLRLRYQDDPSLTKIVGVTSVGHGAAGPPVAYPEVALGYTGAEIDPTVRTVLAGSVANLPGGVDGRRAQWVDLDGEGLPGALVEASAGWHYKRNLGAAALGAVERLPSQPSLILSAGGQLLDLGDGKKSVARFDGPVRGSFERTFDGGWTPLLPFRSLPHVRWDDPNLRFVDLDGDGVADVLITDDQVLRWYPSLGREGFGEPELVRKPFDDERGPALVFADGTEQVYLADMTGDGLTDLVRVRNGEVCYWPSLGYGNFGAKIVMGGAPRLDTAEGFAPSRVRLADIDGSGTTDLLYCEGDRVRYWLNLAGNRFGDEQTIEGLPYDAQTSLSVIDLLGNGTSCLVWSSPLPSHAQEPLRYVELTSGKKPHLLESVDNRMGMRTTIEHAASTRFYLEDRAAGRPWATRVPFPVQVVLRTTTVDEIGGGSLVAEYSYHHGFYDGIEREFRGFGLVEQRDTQSLAALESRGLFPAGVEYVPPVRTRSWFHTGAFFDDGRSLTSCFRNEYFALDPHAYALADSAVPADLDAEEWREALRALRGKPLRVEVYADDETVPYQTVEHNHQVRLLQHRGAARHAAFACDPRETLTHHYERQSSDPRVEHEAVLHVGPYGAVEKSARVAYPRRGAKGGAIVTSSEHDLIARDADAEVYRVNAAARGRLYEVTGLAAGAQVGLPQLSSIAALAGTTDDLVFHQTPNLTRLQRRLVRASEVHYYRDDDKTPAPVGALGARGLLYQTAHAVMPEALVPLVLPAGIDLGPTGYVAHDGHLWCPSEAVAYAATSFFQPTRFTDPFGNPTDVGYDAHQLLPSSVTNALGQTTSVTYDYRALAPSRITDVNHNATLAAYDALGRLRDVARTGKNGEGDTLAAPSEHHEYTLTDWRILATPNRSYTRRRIEHGQNLFQESYVWSDGFGRELMTKVKAEPGKALRVEGGALVEVQADDRWVAGGRTVYDNKGQPVRKYEPFYAVGAAYESDPLLAFLGVSSVLHYDPMGRVVRTDQPDGSFSTSQIGAWELREADGNDNVDEEARLWAKRPGQTAADHRAATATRRHRRTPTRQRLDALGRGVATLADNTIQEPGADTPDGSHVLFETRSTLDIEGRPTEIFDDKGLRALPAYATLAQTYDMLGRRVRGISADAGTTSVLGDCGGSPVYARDARGFEQRQSYDALRRPTVRTVTDTTSNTSWTAERVVYGDDPSLGILDASANLVGKPYQQFDDAGIETLARYDFKGNLLERRRQLLAGYGGVPDWTVTYLDPFITTMEYDALDRVQRVVLPRRDGGRGVKNEIRRAYLPHGPLFSISLTPQFGSQATPVLASVEYDAKGRRTVARHGNGIVRRYTYDLLTSRLTSATAARKGKTELLQDIRYTYDAVGNVTEISDAAQPTIFRHNQKIEARATYAYDSIYRLTDATGREMRDLEQPAGELPFGAWSPDGDDLVNYREHYAYDGVGNLSSLVHSANNNTQNWTRDYGYEARSNRLIGTSLPGAADPSVLGASYGHDPSGNIKSMPHIQPIGWDARGRLTSADRGGGSVVFNSYDGASKRVRKVQTRTVQGVEIASYERIYLDGYEVYRELDPSGAATLEREALHALDGEHRITLVETRTDVTNPAPVWRYQIDNHLGSAVGEFDEQAALLSYEEYHPFGTTAYHARASIAEVSLKRYRFLGKERDDETGFDYCEARHYCAWLARWVSPDPAGMADGPNPYWYSRDNPVRLSDPSGTVSLLADSLKIDASAASDVPAHLTERPLGSSLGGKSGLSPQHDFSPLTPSDEPTRLLARGRVRDRDSVAGSFGEGGVSVRTGDWFKLGGFFLGLDRNPQDWISFDYTGDRSSAAHWLQFASTEMNIDYSDGPTPKQHPLPGINSENDGGHIDFSMPGKPNWRVDVRPPATFYDEYADHLTTPRSLTALDQPGGPGNLAAYLHIGIKATGALGKDFTGITQVDRFQTYLIIDNQPVYRVDWSATTRFDAASGRAAEAVYEVNPGKAVDRLDPAVRPALRSRSPAIDKVLR